jgi:hypothetical protein
MAPPFEPPPPELGLDAHFKVLLPRLGVVARLLERLGLRRERDLARLLACWSPIGVGGSESLYRQMFLQAGSTPDPAFADDGYGNVLQNPEEKLLAHAETLRAAFQLTGDEFAAIVEALRFDTDTPLTLDAITAVHRRGWLARTLRVSVRELLLLIRWTGLDPFVALDPPHPPVVRLLDLVDALGEAQLKPAQALYLMWDEDITGRAAPAPGQLTELARALRGDLAGVEREFAIADDPTGDIAQARMALVYGAGATDFFFGLLADTLPFEAPYAHPDTTLAQELLAVALGKLGYDDFRKRLTYSGVLGAATRVALKAAAGASDTFKAAVDALYAAGQAAIAPFFGRYPELRPLLDAYVASTDPPERKRTALLDGFLPHLMRRRKAQQAVAAIAAATRSDATLAQALLTDAPVLHAAGAPAEPALADLLAVEAPGLSARFFWRDTATGTPDATVDAAAPLHYAAGGPVELPKPPTAGDPVSGIWSGYVEAPESAFYNIAIEADQDATVSIALGGRATPLTRSGETWRNQEPITLEGGALHRIVVTVEKVRTTLAVRWDTAGRGRETIPSRLLYSDTRVDRLRTTALRFSKAASLAAALRLSPAEITYFATRPEHRIFGEGWISALPVATTPDDPTAGGLRDVLIALLNFVRIRAAVAPGDDELVSLLREPTASLPVGRSALSLLLGWNADSLAALLARLGKTLTDLSRMDVLRRVYDAQELSKAAGISAATLIASIGNDPDTSTVRALEAALGARYDRTDLLEVMRGINGELRGLRRDALVAYILHGFERDPATSHIDTRDKLFEFFLMDVEMDPCMQTSRIRHALSSVQLFIDRCLMNLEPRVAPSSINAAQWEKFMKRYRVWEAQRKVFLWPENWLEPELRDDKSRFYSDLVSELLQGDITEDAAATGLIKYLSRLEEVAQLEPCGMHCVENRPGVADDVAHVVARTAGARRQHYYRRRKGSAWTPWEPVDLDIEDNPVTPVIWGGRLFLFWLQIIRKPPLDPAALPTGSPGKTLMELNLSELKAQAKQDAMNAPETIEVILCWSEYIDGRWQPAKTSDPHRPTKLGSFPPTGDYAFDRRDLVLSVMPQDILDDSSGLGGRPELGLRIRISTSSHGTSFLFYNSYSAPLNQEDAPPHWTASDITYPWRTVKPDMDTLLMTYGRGWRPGINFPSYYFAHKVLTDPVRFGTVQPRHPLAAPWDAPFFFADSRRAYFVSTSRKPLAVPGATGFGFVLPIVVNEVDTAPVAFTPMMPVDGSIDTALDSDVLVRYGDRELGPEGVVQPVTAGRS